MDSPPKESSSTSPQNLDIKDECVAIADLTVITDLEGDSYLDTCVVAHNWISQDNLSCLCPTHLYGRKAAHATKPCQEPTDLHTSKVTFCFESFQQACAKLNKAVEKTDIESEVKQKTTRGLRKRLSPADADLSDNNDRLPAKKKENRKDIPLPQLPKLAPPVPFTKGKHKTENSPSTSSPATIKQTPYGRGCSKPEDLKQHKENVPFLSTCGLKKLKVAHDRSEAGPSQRPPQFSHILKGKTITSVGKQSVNNISTENGTSTCSIGVRSEKCSTPLADIPNRSTSTPKRNLSNSNSDIANCSDPLCTPTPNISLSSSSSASRHIPPMRDSHQGTSSLELEFSPIRNIVLAPEAKLSEQHIPQTEQSGLDILKEIQKGLFAMRKDIESIKSKQTEIFQLLINRTEVIGKPPNFPSLPLQTFHDAEIAEEKMKTDNSIRDYVIKKLSLAARGHSDKECTRNTLKLLMSNHVGTFFNWEGRGDKSSFSKSQFCESLKLAVKKVRGQPDMTQVESAAKDWLKSRKYAKNDL